MAVPFRIRRAEWVAGTLVVVALATMVLSFLVVARARGTFIEHHDYWVTMSDGHGIAPGATVEMLGIEVGKVDRVEITQDNHVRVAMAIDGSHARRIREDSVVRVKMSLGLQTMLGGVALVITPGSPEAAELDDGSELAVVEPSKITDLLPSVGGDEMLQNLETILANTRRITDDLAQPNSEVRALLVNVSTLVASVQRGEGTVGQLLKDDAALYQRLLDTLSRLETSLGKADGLMTKGGKLVDRSDTMLESSQKLVDKTDGVVADAGDVFKKMDPVMGQAGDAMGSLGEAVKQFGETTQELSQVLVKMDRVIEDLNEITRATKKVFPIRRHLGDKNRKPLVDGPSR